MIQPAPFVAKVIGAPHFARGSMRQTHAIFGGAKRSSDCFPEALRSPESIETEVLGAEQIAKTY